MTTILVTPEQLEAASRQFEQARQEIARMNGTLTLQVSMMEALWDGTTKQRFYSDFVTARGSMEAAVELTDSISRELRNHAEKFRLADEALSGGIDPACTAPPPNAYAAPTVDTRNAMEKSADSLKELGSNFMASANERYDKRYDSAGAFLDYWTFGIPKGMWQGYADRADKWLDSPEDFANWATLGVHGTIRETIFPKNAWSTEHWANILGTAGLVGGGTIASTIKPKNYFGASTKAVAEVTVNGRLPSNMLGKNDADPFRDIYGPGRLSHPEEWDNIIQKAKEAGVEVRILDRDIMAYAPKGNGPGQLNIYEDASISALRHEYQHLLDDMAKGYPKLEVTYEFKNRIIMELRAYMVEIKEAERIGNKALANQLWNNYRAERQYLIENFGPVSE